MSKRKIKLTESQVEMLKKFDAGKNKKILKVTKEQYDRLFGTINENEKLTGHPIGGDGGDEYNPQTEKDNENTTKVFNESISEDVSSIISFQEFASQLMEFFKTFVTDPSQVGLDDFWVRRGITWGDFKMALISVGLAVPMTLGGVETIKLVGKSNFINTLKKGALKALYKILTGEKYQKPVDEMSLGDDLEISEAGDYPVGAEHDPNAPWNQEDGESEETQGFLEPERIVLPLIYFNSEEDGVAVFKHKEKLLIFLSSYHDGEALEPYGLFSRDIPEEKVIENFINDMILKGKIVPKKYNDKFYETNFLTIVDDNVKNFCQKLYGGDANLMNILNGVSESTTTGSVGGSFVTPKMWAKSPSDMKFGKDPMYKQGKIIEDESETYLRFAVEMDMYVYAPNEKSATSQMNKLIKLLDKKLPDSRARVMAIKEVPFGKISMGESVDRPGQVEFDDCVKLNNNTEAQDGGCSVGAVDGVVKVKESVYEEVAKKTGRPFSEVKAIIEANFKK